MSEEKKPKGRFALRLAEIHAKLPDIPEEEVFAALEADEPGRAPRSGRRPTSESASTRTA